MTILIAEKPSVGRELARVVHASEMHDGYISGGTLNGDECCVTWAVGHLVAIDAPTPTQWSQEHLPSLPERFSLEPIKERKKQLETIKRLLGRCDLVVNCGDAGREGELIQRYILQWCGYRGPVQRLWISSLTDEAVRHGLRTLKPGAQYDALFQAGRARNEADWLVGMNATMALTAAVRAKKPSMKGVLSLGRVQTPTLAMICSRYVQHRDFVPVDFWRVKINTSSQGVRFDVLSETRFEQRSRAESARKRAEVSLLEVVDAVSERRNVSPPLLHDLTSLQRIANTRLGLTADATLRAAQTLYEKKFITYPRTGSKYISDDILKTIPRRLNALLSDSSLGQFASDLLNQELNTRSVDASKITDHHALLIENNKLEGVTETERAVYMLVAERMLEAFSRPSIEDVMRIRLKSSDEYYVASGTSVVDAGWKAISKLKEKTEDKQQEADDKEQILPQVKIGNSLVVHKTEVVHGETRPKPIHTEASLLSAMEHAGKEIEDKELQEVMKGCGIGTPATRASIIETLKKRRYVTLTGKKLIPTEAGLGVWELTSNMLISDVAMTGQWEQRLDDITRGVQSEYAFGQDIRDYTRKIVDEIFCEAENTEIKNTSSELESVKCPFCEGEMFIKDEYVRCKVKECGLYMNRTVFGKKLGPKTSKKLLETGRTGIVRGFKSKTGKEFEARLKLKLVEKDGKRYANVELVFDTPDTGKKKKYGSYGR